MKDLQELFESLEQDEIKSLSEINDKKSLNPNTVKKILDYVSIIYCAEKNIKEAELSEKEMSELVSSLSFSASLWLNILNGHMKINSGRLKLTDGENCRFSLTNEGVKHVEDLIKK